MSFEESEQELAANFASMGADLDGLAARRDRVRFDYVRLERSEISEMGDYDLEGLFVRLGYAIKAVGAKRVIFDTIEALFSGLDNARILRAELRRLFRWLKDRGMAAVVAAEKDDGERNRVLYILKSCCMAHSNQIRRGARAGGATAAAGGDRRAGKAFTAEKDKLEKLIAREEARLRISEESRGRVASLRKAD